jgi:hypothetical protein
VRRTDMRRLIATLSVAAALVLVGCGSEDADPASDDTGSGETGGGQDDADAGDNETDTGPAVESVTMTRTGGIAGVHETWKIGPSDAGHGRVFEAASPEALDDVGSGSGPPGKPPCCDFFQYNLIVRYDDGTNETFRMWDGGRPDPALDRLVDAVLKTEPAHPDDHSAATH